MAAKPIKTLDVRTRPQWHAWLKKHHASVAEIWLVFHKQHTVKTSLEYEAAVEEALCFGWVDSLVKRLDDERFARKFTPRRPDRRVDLLLAASLLRSLLCSHLRHHAEVIRRPHAVRSHGA